MTRINTLHPADLTNEWLIAEVRELPRIPNKIISGKTKLDKARIPATFRMGTGHEIFFHDKLKYLHKRHDQIIAECKRRGINISDDLRFDYDALPPVAKMYFYNDWEPSKTDHDVLIDRLCERFDLRKRAYHITYENDGQLTKAVINCEHSFNGYIRQHFSKYY